MSTQVLISFDTTGSMMPCLSETRRKVSATVEKLFSSIPDLQMGVITHGDYCDGSMCYNALSFNSSKESIQTFVNSAPKTGGGDSDECYELVLHKAQEFSWSADNRILILIGDAQPHNVGYRYGSITNYLDWKEEARKLSEMGVMIYTVQALGEHDPSGFYRILPQISNGRRLLLSQFSDAVETIMAICYHKVDGQLEAYKQELQTSFRMNRHLAKVFETLGSTSVSDSFTRVVADGLKPVPPYRFQVLHVDRDVDIKSFVIETGASFRKGHGFYEFTKRETIQENKEVVLRHKVTGDMFTGDDARRMIGLPYGERGRVSPSRLEEYDVFVQSTSANRKLIGHTKFLYENEA